MRQIYLLTTMLILTIIVANSYSAESSKTLSLDQWTYIQVDDNRGKWGDWDEPSWLKYFGLDMKDVTGDGYKEIVSGRYFYQNPGNGMASEWNRIMFPINVDGMLFIDVDGDNYADVIGTALPNVYWLEAEDQQGGQWTVQRIGDIPATGHVNGQGYVTAQLVPGGKPEVILAAGDGTYYFMIPPNPTNEIWPHVRINKDVMDEGIGVGDLDGDGDNDIATGNKTGEEGFELLWFENPGDGTGDWKRHKVGDSEHAPDRIVFADINQDERLDVVVSEERYPGKEPDANLYWFEQTEDGSFNRHTVVTQYSMNNLDVADMDNDGAPDIITCEHKGPDEKLQIWENDGKGSFTVHNIEPGYESHLGARVADMDNDGDLDIVSIAWDEFKMLHLWRNDAIQ